MVLIFNDFHVKSYWFVSGGLPLLTTKTKTTDTFNGSNSPWEIKSEWGILMAVNRLKPVPILSYAENTNFPLCPIGGIMNLDSPD